MFVHKRKQIILPNTSKKPKALATKNEISVLAKQDENLFDSKNVSIGKMRFWMLSICTWRVHKYYRLLLKELFQVLAAFTLLEE